MKKTLLLLLTTFFFSASLFAQWIEQSTGFATASRGIGQIVIIDENTVWASAYNGTAPTAAVREFTRTTDGGNTWVPGVVTGPPTTNNWSCISAVDDQKAWGVFYKTTGTGLGGGLWHTTDGGTTWTQQTAFGTSSFPDIVYFWDENTGVAGGDPVSGEYELYTTTDGGTTWTPVSGANIPDPTTGEYGLVHALGVKNNVIWWGTTNGRLLKSTDYGNNWSVYTTGYDGYYIGSITFADENLGWCTATEPTGAEILLLRTKDGGNTWTNLTQDTYYEVSHVPNTEETIVVSWTNVNAEYGSSYSLDGGDTWTEIDNGVQHTTVNFLNHLTGWSGGFNADATTGGIYKYDGAFVATGISPVQANYQFKLYPNPSDGLFYISFDAENNLPINVLVMDAAGKVVLQKTYEDKSQLWLRSIDLREFAQGVYFMKVENNGNETIEKLIVQ